MTRGRPRATTRPAQTKPATEPEPDDKSVSSDTPEPNATPTVASAPEPEPDVVTTETRYPDGMIEDDALTANPNADPAGLTHSGDAVGTLAAPLAVDPHVTGTVEPATAPNVVLSTNDGSDATQADVVDAVDVHRPTDEERAAAIDRARIGEPAPWPDFLPYDGDGGEDDNPAVGTVLGGELLPEDTTAGDGRPACRVEHEDGVQLPELTEGGGLCGHHWVVLPHLREVARRDH